MKRWSMAAISARVAAMRVKQIAGFSLHKTAADRPLHGRW